MTEEHSTAPAAAAAAGDGQEGQLPQRQLILVFVGMMLAVLLAALDQTIVATALPTIVGDLGGLEHMSWVVTAYLLSSTVSLTIYGKLGDLFGRKPVFLFAIVTFLAGSALTGMSQDMGQLIAFRALQGIGGGGLMISMQAIIGDLLSPRERGRYMGWFGAVFAVSSVAGPLIGGFLTDQWSWRWCFYINLPLGLVTLAVVTTVLKLPKPTTKPKLDYLGAALLAAAVTGIVLVTTWGGTEYEWTSPTIILLGIASVALLGGFVLAERSAAEPIMPLHLFRSRVFNIANGIGFVIGIGMFGTIAYLPSYFQMVLGDSATASGLRMLPMMAGVLVASITSGRRISTTGTYKRFPIAGVTLAGIGLVLLSRLDADTPYAEASLYMLVLGTGIGLVMQVIVLVVQNAAAPADLGTATSATNFLRQIGGSIGASVAGSIFAERLTSRLAERLPAGGAGLPSGSVSSITPAIVEQLPGPIREVFVSSYVDALAPVFLFLSPLFLVALVLALILPEVPLRTERGVGAEGARGGSEEPASAQAHR